MTDDTNAKLNMTKKFIFSQKRQLKKNIIDFSNIDLTNILMITENNGLKDDANSLVKLAFELINRLVEADLKILKP